MVFYTEVQLLTLCLVTSKLLFDYIERALG